MNNKRYEQCALFPACIPWDDDYAFDRGIFAKHLQSMFSGGCRHIYLFGTAGEGYALADDQYGEIITAFAELAKEIGFSPQAGSISLSALQIKRRVETALNCGIREFQFSLPAWHALSDAEVSRYFHDVCDAFPEVSFLNYNLPRTKRLLTVSELADLSAEIPNLVGAKFMTDGIGTIYQMVKYGGPLRFFTGETSFAYSCLIGGGLGLLPSTCNARRTLKFYEACISGDLETVFAELNLEHTKTDIIVNRVFPDFRVDGNYDKMLAKIETPDFPLRLLPPYEYCSDEYFETFVKTLQRECPEILD